MFPFESVRNIGSGIKSPHTTPAAHGAYALWERIPMTTIPAIAIIERYRVFVIDLFFALFLGIVDK